MQDGTETTFNCGKSIFNPDTDGASTLTSNDEEPDFNYTYFGGLYVNGNISFATSGGASSKRWGTLNVNKDVVDGKGAYANSSIYVSGNMTVNSGNINATLTCGMNGFGEDYTVQATLIVLGDYTQVNGNVLLETKESTEQEYYLPSILCGGFMSNLAALMTGELTTIPKMTIGTSDTGTKDCTLIINCKATSLAYNYALVTFDFEMNAGEVDINAGSYNDLMVDEPQSIGLANFYNFTMNGGDLYAYAGGFYSMGGEVDLKAEAYAIMAQGEYTQTGGSVTAKASPKSGSDYGSSTDLSHADELYAISCSRNLTITDGQIDAEAGLKDSLEANSPMETEAIYVGDNLTIGKANSGLANDLNFTANAYNAKEESVGLYVSEDTFIYYGTINANSGNIYNPSDSEITESTTYGF